MSKNYVSGNITCRCLGYFISVYYNFKIRDFYTRGVGETFHHTRRSAKVARFETISQVKSHKDRQYKSIVAANVNKSVNSISFECYYCKDHTEYILVSHFANYQIKIELTVLKLFKIGT